MCRKQFALILPLLIACGPPASAPGENHPQAAVKSGEPGDSATHPSKVAKSYREQARARLVSQLREAVDAYWKTARATLTEHNLEPDAAGHDQMWHIQRPTLERWTSGAEIPSLYREAVVVLCLDHWDANTEEALLQLLTSPQDEYQGLNAALCLALNGRKEAIPILRQVLSADGFGHYAESVSGYEYGSAALGLALLGDTAHRHAIEVHRGGNAAAEIDLALRALGPQSQ